MAVVDLEPLDNSYLIEEVLYLISSNIVGRICHDLARYYSNYKEKKIKQ